MPVISVANLLKEFGKTPAVNNLTFDIRTGSVTALLGGNGAGKTTTMTMLLGLMLPTSGSIKMLGHDMIRNRHAVLPFINFSSPYVDMPQRLTVRQNLVVYANLYALDNIRERLKELADNLQLVDFFDRPYGTLSAGQKTRVSLAKALLNSPRLLLLDEPTASLDPDTADWVRTWLLKYQRSTGATIFMASHNMYEVERMCEDVIMMRQGSIVDRGSPEELLRTYDRTNLEEVFLDIARANHV